MAALNVVTIAALVWQAVGAWMLGRSLGGRAGGWVAWALFTFAPYQLVNIFVRGNFPKFVAGSFAPWALWTMHRLVAGRGRWNTLGYATFLAAITLCHNISGLTLGATITVAGLVFAATLPPQERKAGAGRAILTSVAGDLLSAFFWLPILAGRHESIWPTTLLATSITGNTSCICTSWSLPRGASATGLVWQRDGSGARAGCSGGVDGGTDSLTCTWAEAQGYCAALVLGGVSGWRLPARMELLTIVDFTVTNPSIDLAAFPNTPAYSFWTSSPYAGSSGQAWCFDFSYGEGSVFNGVQYGNGVRCVRSWPLEHSAASPRCYPTTRFVAQGGELVRDTLTQLTWQQQASSTTMNWVDAQTYCSSAGFRLPTVKELGSLVDLRVAVGATINQTAFPATSAEWFWTSSPYAGSSVYFAWGVQFGDGISNGNNVSSNDWVRCVR